VQPFRKRPVDRHGGGVQIIVFHRSIQQHAETRGKAAVHVSPGALVQRVLQLRVGQGQKTDKTDVDIQRITKAKRVFHLAAEAIVAQQVTAVNSQHRVGVPHGVLQPVN